MAVYAKTCPWCGKTFVAGREDKIYCSSTCRANAGRWRRDGGWTLEGSGIEASAIKDELVESVVALHAAAAVLRAASEDGAPALRPVCKRLSDVVLEALDREGL